MNKLFFGDNLDILREYVDDQSIDLIYLDPPFNSQAQYNVLFESPKNAAAAAQAEAFRDTWTWGDETNWAYREIMASGGGVAKFIEALRSALGQSDMMAYLVMMAVRLQELHRKLKPEGALFLHCDPTASHYLKIILDAVFGPQNYLNEIIWRRTGSHNKANRFGPIHDVIHFYRKSDAYRHRPVFRPYLKGHVESYFKQSDERGRYWTNSIHGAGTRNGESGQKWRGYDPTARGRHWAVPGELVEAFGIDSSLPQHEKLDTLADLGLVDFPDPSTGSLPTYRQYLDSSPGLLLQDIWAYQPYTKGLLHESAEAIDEDVRWLPAQGGRERIGYPTQKPLGLLDRVIRAASDEGGIVLDPFCGCGTTVEAAQRLGRQWIGIDIAIHAVKVIEARLGERIGEVAYDIEGMPRDFASAVKLAERDKYQFQWWANYLFNPHALREQKKGADRGIDGELFFPNGPARPWGRMLTSVKGGSSVGPAMVRDFRGVIERENAEMGLFICLHHPTAAMQAEADAANFADTVHGDIPRIQIVSIQDWFDGRLPKLPPLEHLPTAAFSTAKRRAKAKAVRPPDPSQPELPLSFTGGKSTGVKRHFNPTMVYSAPGDKRKTA
ncbi:site-specific DNA-methyltransferase [Nitratireductor alexandrii]|uniref:site-specific DNA-methyltransferase n=1 Tax=Nitratireductor alexandrii TaxID=2448161 RepID=UPI000FD98DAD|nr:site-specific DNA-methyltransferase [Nitratireductor alexandrii]